MGLETLRDFLSSSMHEPLEEIRPSDADRVEEHDANFDTEQPL